MTDTEIKRRKAICEVAGVKEIEDVSDGFHTFKELYYQRMMLFAVLVKQNKDKAWKSLRHSDGELCFGGGWFIVGIDTPEGSYTYHYEDNFYSLFDCIELERGKVWDGHTEEDVTRLLSLEQKSCDDAISRQWLVEYVNEGWIEFDTEKDKNILIRLVRDFAPSAQPKMGRWIDVFGGCECSECGCLEGGYSDYCPNCGAKMVDPQESEEA